MKKFITPQWMENQSFGIINDFEFWFPKLNQFSPKLFIFYIGLNDKFYRGNCRIVYRGKI